ncbi:hypothetical protein QR680_012541 [Steinernema hermaphroditum]|uniref:Palmitoyltransferase n=1 Tax=Steinernema hermaphroditum TaxID=289476 RepID=A0AA39M0W9_9BILA|nr:hypothetical protein QR680_012541 [Steinernema hermaphroditum]
MESVELAEAGSMRRMFRVGNIVGMSSAVLLLTLGAGVNTLHTCPMLYGFDACRWMTFCVVLFYLQAMANFFLVRFTYRRNEVSKWIEKVSLPQRLVDRFKFCVLCNSGKPRRSYHCHSCGICTLRCDHHCFCSGACIGIANQRYFIVWIFWSILAVAVTVPYMYEYVQQYAVRSEFFGYVGYFPPIAIIRSFFGCESLSTAMVISLLYLEAYVGSMAAVLLVAQVFYVLNGFTLYEYHFLRNHAKKPVKGDGGTASQRLQLIFGQHWYLSFIFPQPFRPTQLTPEIIENLFDDGGDP